MNNSLVDLFHCQQKVQNDTIHTLQAIQQSQRNNANDSLIDDIPTFYGKAELNFDWIYKLENTAVVTKQNPKVLALGKFQEAELNCLKSFHPDTIWNNVKTILHQKFSLVSTVIHVGTCLVSRYQQKEEALRNLALI